LWLPPRARNTVGFGAIRPGSGSGMSLLPNAGKDASP
jgi:hypothetical protein